MNASNYIELDYANDVRIGRKIARYSEYSVSDQRATRKKDIPTLVIYVREQYMSPKKKSRNSTGYNPARSKRHYKSSAMDRGQKGGGTHMRIDKPSSTSMK